MDYLPDLSQAAQKFKNLNSLDARFLGIKHVERKKLKVLKDITWLTLYGNNIEDLEADTFADLMKVELLIIGLNKLSSLPLDLFKFNVKLRELWIQYNNLGFVPDDHFRNNNALRTIYADENSLRTVKCKLEREKEAQKCVINIELINEKSCKINFDDQSNPQVIRLVLIYGTAEYLPVMNQAVQKFKNLRELDVGFLKTKYVEREKLRIMKEITYISLFGNKIEVLEGDTFVDLKKVEKILLASNQLKNLHQDIFKNNVKLEEVWLQDNQLEVLSRQLFLNNVELKNIYASGNRLKKININFLSLPNLQNIDLTGNVCINEWCGVGDFCGTGSKQQMQTKITTKCS